MSNSYNIFTKFLFGLLLLSLAGCLASQPLPPLTFEGHPRELKPGDVIETRTGEIISAEGLLSRLKDIQVVYSHPYYPVAFVVAKGAHTFLDQMNGALTQLIADGTVDQMKAKWHAQT